MAFYHIKFQSIPLLMPFTLIDNPQFYCLEMSLSNILMIGLFRSNNRMVIFSKIEKEFIWQQTCKGPYIYTFMFHMEGVWPHGGLKFVTCLLILLFLNKRSVVRFWRWREWGTGCGGSQNWSFFVAVINVWPLNGLKLQPIQWEQAVVSSLTSRHKPDTFWLRR